MDDAQDVDSVRFGEPRLGGGAIADDPVRRRSAAVGGYTATAVLSAGIGVAGSVPWVGV